jgi:hypothetical protein
VGDQRTSTAIKQRPAYRQFGLGMVAPENVTRAVCLGGHRIVVLNKIDIRPSICCPYPVPQLSAQKNPQASRGEPV